MAPCIVLSSENRLIKIESEDCALQISSCRTCLYFVPNLSVKEGEQQKKAEGEEKEGEGGPPAEKRARPDERSIRSVLLRLARSADDETVTVVDVPYSIDRRLRIDCLLPLVFDPSPDALRCTIAEDSLDVASHSHNTAYSLAVSLRYGSSPTAAQLHSLASIHTGSVSTERMVLPVSKELMSLDSPFFSTIFYGGFSEQKERVKEIHDMARYELKLFVVVLHRRHPSRVVVNAPSQLTLLRWADYFGMLWLLAKVRQLLLQQDEIYRCHLSEMIVRADKLPPHLDDVKNHLIDVAGTKSWFLTDFCQAVPAGISPAMTQLCLNRVHSAHAATCRQKDEKIAELEQTVEELRMKVANFLTGRNAFNAPPRSPWN